MFSFDGPEVGASFALGCYVGHRYGLTGCAHARSSRFLCARRGRPRYGVLCLAGSAQFSVVPSRLVLSIGTNVCHFFGGNSRCDRYCATCGCNKALRKC